jgi:hypothetical protein
VLSQKPNHDLPISVSLWLFALTYLVLMTIASKKSIRYMLPAFSVFYLLVGQAFFRFNRSVSEWIFRLQDRPQPPARFKLHPIHLARFLPRSSASLLTFLILFFLVLFALVYHPYYFTYYNPLLLGWRWAPKTLLVGWGEGLDEAARYLNDRPQTTVSAWYERLFPVFYKGETEPVVPQENLITADYAVLYINQVQRDIPSPNIVHYFRTRRQPEYTVRLNGIDYAWIYPGPIAGFQSDASPQYPFDGNFGGEVQLLGYDLSPQPLSGQPLIVTLYWRVLTTPSADRFVFVRVVDDQGRIWAKTDGPPVMGLWPTGRWQPGMIIEDAQELVIPPGTPPGVYRLEVGLYDPDNGQTLPASGQPVGQGGGLLLGEVPVEWQPSKSEPDLPHQTDLRLASNARVIGYDSPPATASTGDMLPIRLGWREDKTLSSFLDVPNDLVMFEWQVEGEPVAEQLEPLPLPIAEWGSGAMLLSQHEVMVPPTLESGQYEVVVRLHTGSDPAGESFSLGTVEVVAPAHRFELPSDALTPVGPARLAPNITLTGYNFDLVDRSLALQLYWQTESPINTRYKVFAQLLSDDDTLIAQSDSFPAAGKRPTTGWLPGEIITDPHSLPLSSDTPPGTYRLIAGMYNPLTGERLPVLDDNGNLLTDAILVAELSLP